jgi:hypothetical protein
MTKGREMTTMDEAENSREILRNAAPVMYDALSELVLELEVMRRFVPLRAEDEAFFRRFECYVQKAEQALESARGKSPSAEATTHD